MCLLAFLEKATCLLDDSSRSLAEDTLTEEGQEAAASALAVSGASGLEVGRVGDDAGRTGAVEVGNAQNIGSAAQRADVQAGAGGVGDLAGLDDVHGGGREDGGRGGEDDGEGGLHYEVWFCGRGLER